MKLITRDTDYAIRAISFIARHNKDKVSVSELIKKLKIPKPFLRKILQTLNKEKILKSHKGKNGGFELAISSNKIYLLDLIRIFQGNFSLNECFLKKMACPNKKSCILRRKIRGIENFVIRQLKTITIASLVN